MKPKQPFNRASGFTRSDALILACVLLGLGSLVSALINTDTRSTPSRSNQLPDSAHVRAIHQSMVIYAQNNNTYLPGMDDIGRILPANAQVLAGAKLKGQPNELSGASMAARYYILLNGSFIDGKMLHNTQDTLWPWKSPAAMPTTDEFSYALLRIGSSATTTTSAGHEIRLAEWRDYANSRAILISDRNTASAATSDKVRSVWSTSAGSHADWKGVVLWGDNHAEFLNANNARLGTLTLDTRYGSTTNSDDFLFGETSSPGKLGTASAMFGYTSANF